MPSTVIVQYVPDAVMNERINIGVIILHDGQSNSLFINNWQRVKQFAGRDISFLKDIERESRVWDESAVLRLASQWTGSVQLTPPRFTTLPPHEALIDAGRRYLFERTSEEYGYRDKTDAVRLVRSRIKEKLVQKFGAVGRALIRDSTYELKGTYLAYQFDVTVGNGSPYFSAQGISFEVPNTRRLDKEITSTAWLIEDVKRQMPEFPIGVAVLPPRVDQVGATMADTHKLYADATRMFEDLRAEVIPEKHFTDWAEVRVDHLPAGLSKRPR